MARFTVLGATGFIGRHLIDHLERQGEEVFAPHRDDPRILDSDLGHVVYAIGLTADFRSRPFDTIEAHVCRLSRVLESATFASLVYLSSTRVYAGAESGSEDAKLRVDPTVAGDLYNLSKLAGEALCFTHPSPAVRVARLSNVFSATPDALAKTDDFLPSIVRAAVDEGGVRLETAPDSTKDYVWIGDVVRAVHRIATDGAHRLYNVASGKNTANGDILGALQRITGCDLDVVPGAPRTVFPTIDVARIGSAFTPPDRPWAPADLIEHLEDMVAACGGKIREPAGVEA